MKLFAFYLALFLFTGSAHATQSGFSYNGVCYPTPEAANAAFIASFPNFQNSNTVTLSPVNPPSVSSSGVITFSFTLHPIGGSATGYSAYTLNLMPCDYEEKGWGNVEQSAVMFYGLLMLCFFLGVRMGFLV